MGVNYRCNVYRDLSRFNRRTRLLPLFSLCRIHPHLLLLFYSHLQLIHTPSPPVLTAIADGEKGPSVPAIPTDSADKISVTNPNTTQVQLPTVTVVIEPLPPDAIVNETRSSRANETQQQGEQMLRLQLRHKQRQPSLPQQRRLRHQQWTYQCHHQHQSYHVDP